jgi:hypothetical protein
VFDTVSQNIYMELEFLSYLLQVFAKQSLDRKIAISKEINRTYIVITIEESKENLKCRGRQAQVERINPKQ